MNQNNASRRTFQEVHRDSKLAGSVEAALWAPTDQAARADALEAARRYELTHKRKGRRNGPLGHVGLEVLQALWSAVEFSTGRLDPSLRWIMEKTGRCRDAVVTALKRLARCGFVRWIRRFAFTGQAGQRGQQVEQVSNAYALDVPADAAAMVPAKVERRTAARGSSPADYRRALAQLVAERSKVAAHASALPYRSDRYRDPVTYLIATPSKGLKKLADLLAECESAAPVQSR